MAVPNPFQPPTWKKSTAYGTPYPTAEPVFKASQSTPKSVPAPPEPEARASAQAWINNPDSGQGGLENYTKTQNDRYKAANQSGDKDLIARLEADSKRVGYTLDPYTPPAPDTAAPKQFSDWQAKTNELLTKYEALLNTPFQYNPQADPKYLAAQQLAKSRAEAAAKDAEKSTLETMNERGILNSTVTASQLSQNENKYRQQAETEALALLPQYEAAARGDYQDRLRNAASLLSFSAGRGDTAYDREYTTGRDARRDMEADRTYDRGVLESDRNYDRGVLESDRTYDFQKATQEWEQNFNQEQFDWQKAQQVWENAFQEKNFEQQMEEAAAARGLQWATLNQRDKEFIADQEWRRKEAEREQQKIDAAAGTTDFEASVMNELGTFDNAQDAMGWLKENAAEITRRLGSKGLADLQKMLPNFYGEDAGASADLRQRATEAAMKDTRWLNGKPEVRNALIQEYMKYYQ